MTGDRLISHKAEEYIIINERSSVPGVGQRLQSSVSSRLPLLSCLLTRYCYTELRSQYAGHTSVNRPNCSD